MYDRTQATFSGIEAVAPAPLPIAAYVRGKPVEEVAEVLPRLFNLCRAAQGVAIRLALGLPSGDVRDLATEICKDHIQRLAVILPLRFGLTPLTCSMGDAEAACEALFAGRALPETREELAAFLQAGAGIAPLLQEIMARFAPGEACCDGLPVPRGDAVLQAGAMENSVAARHMDHPVMRCLERAQGRGPVWRVMARALDLQAAARGDVPLPVVTETGTAVVPSARGLYAVRAEMRAGRVTALTRVTPTDHLLVPGGIMAQSLANLPPQKHDWAQGLVDILDPCVPVELRGVNHA